MTGEAQDPTQPSFGPEDPGPEDPGMPSRGPQRPLPEQADVVIIGAGIMGLAIAHELRNRGVERVVVLDKGYLCGGASGRNGGGVRAQWSSETNIGLMRESIRICKDFATKMRINVWFRQGGYLFLARSEERAKQLEASVALQNSAGAKTKMIDTKAIANLAPELDVSRVLVGSYNPEDGVVFPWPFVWGYARACESQNVEIHTFTEVSDFLVEGDRVVGVQTPRGAIRAPRTILATGAYSPELAKKIDLELPNHPHRHEICATEPLKPFLKPFVADLGTGLYFSQSMRGEIVGGISNAKVPDGLNQDGSLRFLGLYARSLTRMMPRLGEIRILRQWAGCYDITPDGNPLVGEVDERPGLYLSCGFMGHGFMMAPVMARMTAGYLTANENKDLFDRWNFRRYREGRLLSETMILG